MWRSWEQLRLNAATDISVWQDHRVVLQRFGGFTVRGEMVPGMSVMQPCGRHFSRK